MPIGLHAPHKLIMYAKFLVNLRPTGLTCIGKILWMSEFLISGLPKFAEGLADRRNMSSSCVKFNSMEGVCL